MRKRRKRIITACVGCLVIAFFAVVAETYIQIYEAAKRTAWPHLQSTLSGPATVIVLGMGPTQTGAIIDRSELAAELWQRGFANAVIASGGQGHDETESEAETIATDLVTRGVPAASIQEEKRSTSTFENLLFSREMLAARGLTDSAIIIVTHDYHAARVASIASSLGINASVITVYGSRLNSRVLRHMREVLAFLKWKIVGL